MRRIRRAWRRVRSVLAAALGPVLAVQLLVPVAVATVAAAGAVAATVASAAQAKAAVSRNVLVLLQNGETTAPETSLLQAAGYTVTQATPSTWAGMTTAQFESYSALVIGDPSTSTSCSALTPTTGTSGTDAIGTAWQPAVSGNVAVLGTAPAMPGTAAASTLITDSVEYAVGKFSSAGSGTSSSGTGLYVSLNCEYSTSPAGTAVPLLNGVEGIGTAGSLQVRGSLACTDPGTVNRWEISAAGTYRGFTSGSLSTSAWGSGCPVDEAFSSWPTLFTPAAIDAASDATADFTASDGTSGQPYVLLGSPVSTMTAALAPSAGGEVLAGTTAGGTSNPAAPGLSQGSAGDPVNTENGDFTQSAADVTIPGFGPSLGFSRSYDSGVARQQTQAGTPGPLGYGWTSNWDTSLHTASPVPGDIYSVAATQNGLNQPYAVTTDPHGDVLISDSDNNRVQEIAVYTHTQFGIAMTAGDVYTVAGSSSGAAGYGGDGGPATSALLNNPNGIAVDPAGNLYIADYLNSLVRKVDASTGIISTFAGVPGKTGSGSTGIPASQAVLSSPESLAVNAAGDVFIGDPGNFVVEEVPAASGTHYGIAMTAGDIYVIAGQLGSSGNSGDGGPATSALMLADAGLAVDPAGDVYISDIFYQQVREVAGVTRTQWGQPMTAGDIYTVAGSTAGTAGSTGDGGPARAALLNAPYGISTDSSGNLYIADLSNNRIREIASANGTQWGQPMTAGDIYTVAGSGTAGQSGNGGPATSAQITEPYNVAADPAGDLFILPSDASGASASSLEEVTASATSDIPAAPGQASSLSPAPGGITITQPGGAQVTFYPQANGTCTVPYTAAGSYCVLPQFTGAILTSNTSNQTYTFKPSAAADSYTYSSNGNLIGQTDIAGDTLTVTYNSPTPGSGNCPSTAASCETITAASGRTLVIGSNSSGLVTSVSDPIDRTWTYGYNSASQLTSVTDPLGHVTSYTYGAGSTSNPLLASDLLTITAPNGQSGGPDAGADTVNVYDSAGRVTSQTDPMGFKTTFNYCASAAAGNCMNPATGTGYVTVAGPDGNTTIDYYDQGSLAGQTDLTNGTVTSEQDNTPNTTGGTLLDAATTDGNGNTTSYTYDAAGNTTSTTDPGGNTTTTQSTALNQTSCDATAEATTPCSASQVGPAPVAPGGVITPPSSAPPSGVTYTLYDTNGNKLYTDTGVYQPGSPTASYQKVDYSLYKGNSVTLNGTAISCTYTPPSPLLPCAKINPDGVVTQMQYDSAGDLTLSATPDGNSSELATTTYGYDSDGEQTSKISPDGNLSGANAANYTTVTAYNNDGKKTSVTRAGGSGATVTPRVTKYGYDPSGNQTTAQDARGYTTTTTYNADDKATLVTDPLGDGILTCYDGAGNVTQTVPSTGVAANNLTPSSCPASYPAGYGTRLASDATTYTYNADGNKTASITPAPAGLSGDETTTYTYDAAGDVIKTDAPPTSNTSGAPDNITVDTYNSNGELTSQTAGYGTSTAATVSYCYDPDKNKTAVVSGVGNTNGTAPCESSSPWVVSSASNPTQAAYQTTYAYDSADQQVSTTTPATTAAPNGATTLTTYDPAGNELTTQDPNGVTTTYTYTPPGQKATVTYSGSSAHSVTYKYDANGFKTGMTDASGSSSYTPDPFGELTSTANGSNQVTSYSYDADGNIVGITYPLPSAATWATTDTVNYGYDNADRLTSVTDFTGNKITIAPNADGQQKSETLSSTGDTITTTYDNTGTGVASDTLSNSTSALLSFSYGDAPSGNILTETDSPSSSGTSKAYTYDAQGRVASETAGSLNASYGFDPSGDLAVIPGGAIGAYDHASELTSSALSGTTTDYAYNADGERTGATRSGSTIASAAWNGAGQLTAYSNSTGTMTSATYDGDGLRVSSATASGTLNYVWNTVPQVPQLLADSANAYIYTSGTTPAEQVNLSSGTVTYLDTDSLGSVRGTVNSSGSLTGTTTYDAWGNPLTTGGLIATTPFGYAGSYTDTTGVEYLINRYYDPGTGQFLSVDPLVGTTEQAYAYASGNPVFIKDPSGETGCSTAHWDLFGFQIGPVPIGVPQGTLIQCLDGPGLYVRWAAAGFYHTPITRYCPWHWHYELQAWWDGALRAAANKGGATGPTCANNINFGASNLLGGTRWTIHYRFPVAGTFITVLWGWNNHTQYYQVANTAIVVHA